MKNFFSPQDSPQHLSAELSMPRSHRSSLDSSSKRMKALSTSIVGRSMSPTRRAQFMLALRGKRGWDPREYTKSDPRYRYSGKRKFFKSSKNIHDEGVNLDEYEDCTKMNQFGALTPFHEVTQNLDEFEYQEDDEERKLMKSVGSDTECDDDWEMFGRRERSLPIESTSAFGDAKMTEAKEMSLSTTESDAEEELAGIETDRSTENPNWIDASEEPGETVVTKTEGEKGIKDALNETWNNLKNLGCSLLR